MRNALKLGAGILVAGALLVACGGDDGGGGGDQGGLVMVENAFEPATLTVSSGDTVEVSNEGQAIHNITIEGSDVDEDVDPGASTSITVDLEPGEHTMFCEFHRAAGMEGTVTVE